MNLLFIDGETVIEAPAVENAEVMTIAEVPAGEPVAEAAAEQPAAPGGGWSFWIMIIAMIAIMYFFMWRPESKRRKQMEAFRKGLKKGDGATCESVSAELKASGGVKVTHKKVPLKAGRTFTSVTIV